MACGSPGIAFDRGSVPEVMDDGISGFIVENEAAAIAAVGRLGELDRARVRQQFEQRFTARRMAEDYVEAYELLTETPKLRAVGD
jgi:glycosyltransferase involved in cell wall biosynthesis